MAEVDKRKYQLYLYTANQRPLPRPLSEPENDTTRENQSSHEPAASPRKLPDSQEGATNRRCKLRQQNKLPPQPVYTNLN